ncbi:MAG: SCO family protein [Gammaproteobacteria bacterium]|nr:SCO family protein [Gammaproteobacteria bacterium]
MDHVADNQDRQKFTLHKALWFAGFLLLALQVLNVSGQPFKARSQYPESLREVIFPELKRLQPFSLVDHENNALGLEQLQGRWTFLVFGYTQCPDICPATLSQLTTLSQAMGATIEEGLLPRFLFVSVDPARDNVDVLNNYIKYFDRGFVAATGALRNIEAFEEQFSVFHRSAAPDSEGNYGVIHSAEIFVIDPLARIAGRFTPPISTQQVAQQYRDLVGYFAMENPGI